MLIRDLIGKGITDIYVLMEYEVYGLDKGECFVELDNEIIIDIPFGTGEDVWVKQLDERAASLFTAGYQENRVKYLKNRKIVDFIVYEDQMEKGYIQLDNGCIITETTISPHGTGLAGLNCFESLDDLVRRKGTGYSRLTDVEKRDR